MEWNPDYRYKLLGRLIHANGQYMIAFDLNATETYQRTFSEGVKPKTSKTPVFPAGWQDQFGLSYKEHQQSMQINIFDGYRLTSFFRRCQFCFGLNALVIGTVINEHRIKVCQKSSGNLKG